MRDLAQGSYFSGYQERQFCPLHDCACSHIKCVSLAPSWPRLKRILNSGTREPQLMRLSGKDWMREARQPLIWASALSIPTRAHDAKSRFAADHAVVDFGGSLQGKPFIRRAPMATVRISSSRRIGRSGRIPSHNFCKRQQSKLARSVSKAICVNPLLTRRAFAEREITGSRDRRGRSGCS
jgi:hypothetical protein